MTTIILAFGFAALVWVLISFIESLPKKIYKKNTKIHMSQVLDILVYTYNNI